MFERWAPEVSRQSTIIGVFHVVTVVRSVEFAADFGDSGVGVEFFVVERGIVERFFQFFEQQLFA